MGYGEEDKDNFDENSILIGMIVSKTFLEKILTVDIDKYFSGKYSRIFASWIISYYHTYGENPDSSITELYNTNKHKLSKTDQGNVTKLIESAAERYGDDGEKFDLPHAIDIAERYIQSRALFLRREQEEQLVDKGQILEAYKLVTEFKLPTLKEDIGKKKLSEVLSDMAISFSQLDDMDLPGKELILYGQFPLEKSSVTLITGDPGAGKTFFLMEIARAIASASTGLADTCKANTTTKTLIVDGELPINEIRDRSALLELEDVRCLTLLSKSYLEKNDVVPTLNLNESSVRDMLTDYIIENKFELVILDNLFSLFGGLDLDSAKEWSPVNDWFLKLRSKGIATILAHHPNKAGDQMGTISKLFNINTAIMLKRDVPRDGDENCCCFTVTIKKQRGTGITLPGKKFIFRNNIWSTETVRGLPIQKKIQSSKPEYVSSQPTPKSEPPPSPPPIEPTPRPSLKSGLGKPMIHIKKWEN